MAERIRKLPRKQDRHPETGRSICRHWDCYKEVGHRRRSWCGAECQHDAYMQSNPGYAKEQVEKRDKGICQCCGVDCQTMRQTTATLRSWWGYFRTKQKIAQRFGFTPAQLDQAVQWAYWAEAMRHWEDAQERYKGKPHANRYHRPRQPYGIPEELPEEIDPEIAIEAMRFLHRGEKFAKALSIVWKRKLQAAGWDSGRRTFWDMDHIEEVVRGGSYKLENLMTLCQPCHKAKTARLAAERAAERRGQPGLPLD